MKPASPIHLLERDFYLKFDRHVELWPQTDLPLLGNAKQKDEHGEEPGIWLAGKWLPEVLDDRTGGYLCRELKRLHAASNRGKP